MKGTRSAMSDGARGGGDLPGEGGRMRPRRMTMRALPGRRPRMSSQGQCLVRPSLRAGPTTRLASRAVAGEAEHTLPRTQLGAQVGEGLCDSGSRSSQRVTGREEGGPGVLTYV